jgi:hypothetical protein
VEDVDEVVDEVEEDIVDVVVVVVGDTVDTTPVPDEVLVGAELETEEEEMGIEPELGLYLVVS